VRYSVLPNLAKGFEAALLDKADEIVVFAAAASRAFSQKNITRLPRASSAFALDGRGGQTAGIYVRGAMKHRGLSRGEVAPDSGVSRRADGGHQRAAWPTRLVGTPRRVRAAIRATLKHFALDDISVGPLPRHLQALANTLAALGWACGNSTPRWPGLGGCPYAKGATVT
jgi:hydroxymethylglutaryl-CoA lyase